MSDDGVRAELVKAQQRIASLEQQLQDVKRTAVDASDAAEREAEGQINALVERLADLRRSKEQLVLEVEREEESLTNGLVRQLRDVRAEKASLQQQLETEQEMITNRLNKRLHELEAEKAEFEHQADTSGLLQRLEAAGLSPALMRQVRENEVRHARELATLRSSNAELKAENERLTDAAFLLERRATMESEKRDAVQMEKIQLEHDLEAEDERTFNECCTKDVRGISVSSGMSPALRALSVSRSPLQSRRRSIATPRARSQSSSRSPQHGSGFVLQENRAGVPSLLLPAQKSS